MKMRSFVKNMYTMQLKCQSILKISLFSEFLMRFANSDHVTLHDWSKLSATNFHRP